MKQQIKSMSIPRPSTISYASSTCSSVPPSLPLARDGNPLNLVDTRRASFSPRGEGGLVGGGGHFRGSKTSSSTGESKNVSDGIQPMLVAPPELVAHLERTQMKTVYCYPRLNFKFLY